MDFQVLIWLKFARKLLNQQLEMQFKLKPEWKPWLKKVVKLKTLIQSHKLLESISNKPFQLHEDQLLIWIYKNSNNLDVNLTQALLIRQATPVQTKAEIKLSGQLDPELKVDKEEDNNQMTTDRKSVV